MDDRSVSLASLAGRHVVVVVTGGIAAYKIGYVVGDLRKLEAEVTVVMTENAAKLVGPSTFEALTGRAVLQDLFAGVPDGGVEHVSLARSADIVLVAPATANVLAKMAAGLADDAATTLLLATPAPIVVAPAMNDGMWKNHATQENMVRLRERGVRVVDPGTGFLAEGYEGEGRMAEPSELVASIVSALGSENETAV